MISKSDFNKFIKHLTIVIPKYAPNFTDPTALELWYDAFKEFDIETLRKVYKFARDTLDEFPSIAVLKQICDEYTGAKRDIYKPVDKYAINAEVQALIGTTLQAMCEKDPTKKPSILDQWEGMQDELQQAEQERRSKAKHRGGEATSDQGTGGTPSEA